MLSQVVNTSVVPLCCVWPEELKKQSNCMVGTGTIWCYYGTQPNSGVYRYSVRSYSVDNLKIVFIRVSIFFKNQIFWGSF